jgi:SAM-dependent methyltransferase
MFGEVGLFYLLKHYSFTTVLNIGCGDGEHSNIFKQHNKLVTNIDLGDSYYSKQNTDTFIIGDYLSTSFTNKFDCIWACHVLEHQVNPNLFLKKINADLKEGGILAITVPPLKHNIVGGHVSLWNAGLLLYHLILAGFNCVDASIKQYDYNITIILQKQSIALPKLTCDCGDINALRFYFPYLLQTQFDRGLERFDGNIKQLNWRE